MSGVAGQGRRRPLTRNVERTQLDRWREKHRLSMREAAQVLGVGHATVYHWCSGRSLPTLVMAFHIEEATDGEVLATSWLATTVGKYEKLTYEKAAERSQAEFQAKAQAVHEELERRKAWEEAKQERRRGKPFTKIHLTRVVDGVPVGPERPPTTARSR